MRLTPQLALAAPQQLNCVGERQLHLRSLQLNAIENLGVLSDNLDVIDLSDNALTSLSGELPFPRLTALYLGGNRITKVVSGVAASCPNLRTLILTANNIASRASLNVAELARFKSLEVLSVLDNPVARDPELRSFLLHHVPTLRYINFRRVTAAERKAAATYGAGAKRAAETQATTNGTKERTKRRRRFSSAPAKT